MKIFTIFLVILLYIPAVAAPQKGGQRPPKWTRPSLWRQRLKKGISKNQVRNLFGEPIYAQIGSHGMTWYYQKMPVCVKIKNTNDDPLLRTRQVTKKLALATYGIVIFEIKNTEPSSRRQQMPTYVVSEWKEPDWQRIKNGSIVHKIKPKKPVKPKRKPAKWEISKSWKRLRINMPDYTVRLILGEPKTELTELTERHKHRSTAETCKVWYYTDIKQCGVLHFAVEEGAVSLLKYWTEPFWPEVEKDLYPPPLPRPTKADKIVKK